MINHAKLMMIYDAISETFPSAATFWSLGENKALIGLSGWSTGSPLIYAVDTNAFETMPLPDAIQATLRGMMVQGCTKEIAMEIYEQYGRELAEHNKDRHNPMSPAYSIGNSQN